MSDRGELFIEIGAEEIPAGEVLMAVGSLRDTLVAGLAELRLGGGEVRTYATPRRLAVAIDGVSLCQDDLTKEVSGPPVKIAFRDGQPTKAAEGFARGLGLTVDDLQRLETPKGEYLMAVVEEKGKSAAELIPALVVSAISKIPFKRSMRWGHGDATFVRPIQWIVALHAGEVLDVEYADVKSGRESRGHRFLAPEPFSVVDSEQYVSQLDERHVMVDVDRRRAEIARIATELAKPHRLRPDDELIDEITQLVEKPVGLRCEFDPRYLEIPSQVLISEMREHQRYLAIVDDAGELQPRFVVIGNTLVADEAVVKGGYQRVLTARFEDGVFFFEEDKKRSLAARVDDLANVQFTRALGSIRDKVERAVNLAFAVSRAVAGQPGTDGLPGDGVVVDAAAALGGDAPADDAQRAGWLLARAGYLMKADLTSLMVFEFPELQGTMGRAYAAAQGEPEAISAALEEHYLPRNAGDELPRGALGAALGIADRLDTIAGIYSTGKGPTGTADPFGLRRAALAVVGVVRDRGWHLPITELIDQAIALVADRRKKKSEDEVRGEVRSFIRTRLRGVLVGEGLAVDVVEAALSAGWEDIIDVEARARALDTLRQSDDYAAVAGAFKRVSNILKKEKDAIGEVSRDALGEDAERALFDAAAATRSTVTDAVASRDFDAAFAAIAGLRPAVDQFFEDVMVNADDPEVRARRLALVAGVQSIFAPLADFTRLN